MSRRSSTSGRLGMRRVLAGAVAIVVLAACSDAAGGGDRTGETSSDAGATGAPAASEGTAPPGDVARVITVFDGDSMLVELPDGDEAEVRLAGVNAPERDECFGAEAGDWTTDAAGQEVTLVRVGNEDDTDQFGRLLRDVWAGDRWLNLEAVAAGYASVIHTGRDLEDDLLAAADAAWEDGAGMWGLDVCGPFDEGVVIAEVEWDPPGPDDENANGEYVAVENTADQPVDIGSWVIRDESTQNRYIFDDGDVLEPGDTITVYSGCGDDSTSERYWCADDPVWSNGGDTVLVQTAEGTVVDRIPYP